MTDSLKDRIQTLIYDWSWKDGDNIEDITKQILSLFRQAIEEAKPKEKEVGMMRQGTMAIMDMPQPYDTGYNKGVSDYHDALKEVIRK